MNPKILFLLPVARAACQSADLPERFSAQNLQLVIYRDLLGNRILPRPRAAGEKRRTAWQNWLAAQRGAWRDSSGSVSGSTHWCAQWQENGTDERICKREEGEGGSTLVWFGRGILRDEAAVRTADRIWAGR